MKVLHIIGGGDVGGAKTHVHSLVKELGKHIEVKIVSLRSGSFSDEAALMGIDIDVINSGNIFRDIKSVIGIAKKGGYQLVHAHGAKANLFAVAIRHAAGLPAITTVHSDYRLDYMQNIPKMLSFGLINTIALRYMDYYVAVSGSFKRMLIKRKFDADKIFIVYNGMDFSRPVDHYPRHEFVQRYKLDIDEKDILVGILARFDPVKGLDIFIKAAKLVLDNRPHVKFILGGDGKQRRYLEDLARSLGISKNILFPGWVKNPYEFMSNIDINALTSLSESFPYVILEGVLYKKATVSSDVGGISDLIENGKTGYLFPPGDYKKLAECLSVLVGSDALRSEMGHRIYEKARAEFSLDSMCQAQLEIYRKILGNK